MTKSEFSALFLRALHRAATAFGVDLNTAELNGVEVHAPGKVNRKIVSLKEATDFLFVGSAKFYRIIDVAFIRKHNRIFGFARVSGHAPVSFDETYRPEELGPFKVLGPSEDISARM